MAALSHDVGEIDCNSRPMLGRNNNMAPGGREWRESYRSRLERVAQQVRHT